MTTNFAVQIQSGATYETNWQPDTLENRMQLNQALFSSVKAPKDLQDKSAEWYKRNKKEWLETRGSDESSL